MKKLIRKFSKYSIAMLLVLLLVVGAIPLQPVNDLLDTSLTASATTYTGTAYANSVSSGDILKKGCVLKNNYGSPNVVYYNGSVWSNGGSKTMGSDVKLSVSRKYESVSNLTIRISTSTISYQPLTSISLSSTSFDYTGGTKTVSVTSVRDPNGTVSSSEYDISGTLSASGVGSYTVTAKGKNTHTGTVSATWKINKVYPYWSTKPTGKTVPYTGSAQTIVNAGTPVGGSANYSPSTGTNVGSYTISYSITGDSNHYNGGSGTTTATITAVPATVTAKPTGKTLSYNGSAQALVTAGTPNGGTMMYKLSSASTYSTSIPTGINAGDYTINYYVKGDSNHTDSAVGTVKSTINPIPAKASPAPTGKTVSYTGSAQALANAGTGVGGTIYYKLSTESTDKYRTTIPTAINADSYSINYYVKADNTGNYTDSAVSTIVGTIGKINASVTTAPTAKTLPYNGSAQALATAGTANGGTMMYKLSTESNYSESIPTATNASDNYIIYYYVKGDSNHNDSAVGNITAKITPIPAKANPAPTGKTLPYTGSAQALVNAGTGVGGTIQYKLSTDSAYKTTIPTGVNVGDYTINYYVKADNSGNYTDSAVSSITGKITPIPATANPAPTGKTLSYTGSEQPLVNAGTGVGGTIYYKLSTESDDKYRTSVPTGINADTYKINYYVKGDANHTNSAVSTIEASIVLAQPSYTPPKELTLMYNTTAQKLITPGSSNDGTIKYSLTTNDKDFVTTIPTGINAGDYKVYYKIYGKEGYADLGPLYVTSKIKKIDPVVTAPKGITMNYNGNSQVLIEAGATSGGTMLYSLDGNNYSIELPTAVNADSYTVYYKVQGDVNYNDVAPKTVTALINKIDPVVTPPQPKALSYNGNLQELVTPATTTGGTLMYRLSDGVYGLNIPTAIDKDTYKVFYKVVGDNNYNDVAEKYVESIIDIGNPIIKSPEGLNLVYDGTAQEIVKPGEVAAGTMLYSIDGEHYDKSLPTRIEPGEYTIYYKVDVEGNPNYSNFGPATVTTIIAKATPVVTPPTGKVVDYNKKSQTVFEAGSTTGGKLVYSSSATGPFLENIAPYKNKTDANTYILYYKVNGDEHYEDVEVSSVTAIINKIDPEVTAPKANDLTYNETEQELVTLASTTGGELQYSTDGVNYTTSLPTRADAGNYKVYYKVVGNNNYNDVAPRFVNVEIKKADPIVTLPVGRDIAKTGYDQDLVIKGSVKGGEIQYFFNEELSTEIPKAAEPGEYEIYFMVFGDENHNDLYDFEPVITIIRDITVFTVTFNSNGGSEIQDQTVEKNDTAEKPNNPTKAGFTFGGWLLNGSKYNFNNHVTKDIVLEAQWISNNKILNGNTVSFKDNLNLNFLGILEDEFVDGAYVKMTYNHYGTQKEVIVKADRNNIRDGKYYRFPIELTASEMKIDVKAELYIEGVDEPVSTWTRSIYDYCVTCLNRQTQPEYEKNLFIATLNYGGYTQRSFNYNPAPYAYEGHQVSVANVKVHSQITEDRPYGEKEGIEYVGSSVFFESAPYTRYYFRISDENVNSISDYTFTLNNKEVTPEYENTRGLYYFNADPAFAYHLDDIQHVVVKKGDTTLFDFNYSVIKWSETIAAKGSDTNASEQVKAEGDMAKSLYNYYKAAQEFVKNNP